MAKTLVITQNEQALADDACAFTAAIGNTDALSATVTNLSVSEQTRSGAQVQQPLFQVPNAGPGAAGNPIVTAGTTLYVPFSISFPSPGFPGQSPNQQPSGISIQAAAPAYSSFNFLATATLSDGSVVQAPFSVSVVTGLAPFPKPDFAAVGNFSQGGNAQLIAAII